MTTMLQLEPPLPLLTPKGPALAILALDYGVEHHMMWVCIQDGTGEIWTWPNPKVRGTSNPTMGRPTVQPPELERRHGRIESNPDGDLDKQRETQGADFLAETIRRLRDEQLQRDARRLGRKNGDA